MPMHSVGVPLVGSSIQFASVKPGAAKGDSKPLVASPGLKIHENCNPTDGTGVILGILGPGILKYGRPWPILQKSSHRGEVWGGMGKAILGTCWAILEPSWNHALPFWAISAPGILSMEGLVPYFKIVPSCGGLGKAILGTFGSLPKSFKSILAGMT